MNKVIMDFPELFQKNAFAMWMEIEGLELFKKYYKNKMPEENQPSNIEIEYEKGANENKEIFKAWLTATLKHIKSFPFADLVNYSAKPEFDSPEAEVKMTITEYKTA